MKQYKICLLGAPMVGKTSLVQRFVHSRFSENYHSTIGVKIDKKSLLVGDQDVHLIVWDVQGEERYRKVLPSYLRGMSGYCLVVDVTRPETVTVALQLQERIKAGAKAVPFVLLLNKSDLPAAHAPDLDLLINDALAVLPTSARNGDGVDEAFLRLSSGILENLSRPNAA